MIRVNIYLHEKTVKELDLIVGQEGYDNRSEVVREAIRVFLEKKHAENKKKVFHEKFIT